MTISQPKKRRLIRSLIWLTGGGAFLLVLLPVWFPWVLTPVANRYGLQFADYDRIGWTRFALTGVQGKWNRTLLEAQRVESWLPTVWLWRRLLDRTNGPSLFSLSDGQLTFGESTADVGTKARGSTGATLNQISDIGQLLQQWLPAADLTNCAVQFASNTLTIAQAHWRAGWLQAAIQPPGVREDIELTVRLGGEFAFELSADCATYAVSLHAGFTRTAAGWDGTGELGWLTNRAKLSAQFTTNDWWPVLAQVDCQRWQIPAEILKAEGYEDLSASLTANLVSNRFDLSAGGLAQPTDASSRRGFPMVKFSLSADGDPSRVNLRTLNIQSPLLNAELTNSVGLTWAGGFLAEPAQLRVAADLAKLPGVTFDGKVEGGVRIEPRSGPLPVVHFQFSTGQVGSGLLDAKTILMRGEFAAPVLKFDEVRADFADGSTVRVNGAFDTKTKRIREGHWRASGDFLEKLVSGFSYSQLAASGEVAGPLTNLTHRGEVAITTGRTAELKPFDCKVTWTGQDQHLTAAEIEVTAGASVLSIGAAAELDATEREVATTLKQLSLRRGTEELYALQQPCVITLRAGTTNVPGQLWTMGVDPFFSWRGERHTISATADLAWPSRGEATLSMTNVAFADFSDFVEADLANISLAELAVMAFWSNGPVHSVISVAGSKTNATGEVFDLRVNVKLDEHLFIEQLALASGYAPTWSVTGTLPLKVIPERGEGMLVWDQAQNIALAADWKNGRPESLSVPLGTQGQLEVSQPDLRLRVSGTPEAPWGELSVGATKLAWQSKTNHSPLPKLEDVQLAVEVRPEAIRLKTFGAKLDGQPITAKGEWPLAEEAWRELGPHGKLPNWNQAHGRLELQEAQLAAFSSYLPEMLSPEGRLSVAMELKTGRRLEGVLSLTNAATRSISTITPLRDIAALVRFDGTRAVLENFGGQIGGQPVRADGFASVTKLDGSGLAYHLNLRGTNVPLSRSPELLLRGDFELTLRGGSNLPPLISGLITLRDGLFVQTTSALVWSTPTRPGWRPPYFSVTNAPFADWKLDLAVRGDQFLRVRTPVFSGIASADFQLRGSLMAPVLTGDARVNSGRLIFPFGALTLGQGMASFSGNDPRGPNLQINAAGRNYRYDLRLEVKGPADGANVTLSATPPLTSEQILLMLTAGEMPQSNFAFSNRDRAGRLGTFLGTDLLSRYLGADPAKERVVFRSGESISGEGRLTYSVEYRLTDRWSIIGAYDEFNAFNTDLKWKVLTR